MSMWKNSHLGVKLTMFSKDFLTEHCAKYSILLGVKHE